MKKLLTILACAAISPFAVAGPYSYDQTITAIFGTGNPNGGWTVDTGSGIELGLRAKNRTSGNTTNVSGVYSYATAPATRGLWNYEFSVSSGATNLDAYDFYLSVDGDSSQGISYTTVNALTAFSDDAYGTASTLNGHGVTGLASAFAASNTIAQNSENITFSGMPLVANATYSYELFAVASGAGVGGARLADVGITVVVGQGGAAVPDAASTAAMLALAFAGMMAFKFRRAAALV